MMVDVDEYPELSSTDTLVWPFMNIYIYTYKLLPQTAMAPYSAHTCVNFSSLHNFCPQKYVPKIYFPLEQTASDAATFPN